MIDNAVRLGTSYLLGLLICIVNLAMAYKMLEGSVIVSITYSVRNNHLTELKKHLKMNLKTYLTFSQARSLDESKIL